MKRSLLYSHSIYRKDNILKLEIRARLAKIFYGYIVASFLSLLAILGLMIVIGLLLMNDPKRMSGNADLIPISICLVLFFSLIYLVYATNWSRWGKEIFIFHHDKLEHILENKPFGTKVEEYPFHKIEFCSLDWIDDDTYLPVDIDNIDDETQICLVLNNSDETIVSSERKLPAYALRQLRDEYNRINLKD